MKERKDKAGRANGAIASLRARHGGIRPDEATFAVTFEGTPLVARAGETVAATLAAHDIKVFRTTASGAGRGLYCGMGVCQDCLLEIDGEPNQRACMRRVTAPTSVRRQTSPAALPPPAARPAPIDPPPLRPDVLVIGGGAGGLTAAAVAAEAGAEVVLIDERPTPGGQFFKQPASNLQLPPEIAGDAQFVAGRALIERARAAGVRLLEGVAVNGALPLEVTAVIAGRGLRFSPASLIVATGAYERAWPVAGWTLPGVMTTGAAQTLLRSYRVLAGRRILIAGNGPLNLQVAVELKRAGAAIAAVIEAAPRPTLRHAGQLAAMAMTSPGLLWRGIGYRRELSSAGIALHHAAAISRIDAVGEGLRAHLSDGGVIEADCICLGYGFQPSNELLRIMGCDVGFDAGGGALRVVRDADCRTSIDNVFAVGDCCGLGGAFAAQAEGIIAGLSAADRRTGTVLEGRADELASAHRRLARHRRFQKALWSLFKPSATMPVLEGETLICRCEEVSAARAIGVQKAGGVAIGTLKRQTRLGMGRCQGRYCGPVAAVLLASAEGRVPDESDFPAPRPPLKPVTLAELANEAE